MADKTLQVNLKADDQISPTFRKVGDASKTMGDAIEDSSNRASESTKTLSASIADIEKQLNTAGTTLAAFGAAGTAFYGVATHQSMQFTAAMSNVQSIARVSEAELAALSETIIDLSTQFGAVPTDLAEGLYDIVGSGFEANEALEILTASTVAAGAGLTTTATSATAVTAVLNAYRMSADQAGNVSDILFKVVDSGVISFEELAGSMGRTLPLAASLGVELEELGAAYAALTLLGISPSEAETGIAAIMTAAISPTEALTEAVQAYGYESAEALIKAQGFVGFLDFLRYAAGGSTMAMSDLMGNVRATNAALALGSDDGQVYAEMLDDMATAAQDGAYTLEVFGIQMDNAAGSVRLAQAEIGAAMIAIGAGIEPLVDMGARAVAGIVGMFNDLPPAAQNAATYIGAGTSALALFTGAAMLAVPQALQFADALVRIRNSSAAASILSMTGRLAGFGLAAGLVAFAGYKIWESWDEGRRAADELNQSVATLETTIESLNRQGNTALSNMANESIAAVEAMDQALVDNFPGSFQEYLHEWEVANGQTVDLLSDQYEELRQEYEALIADLEDGGFRGAEVLDKITEAINDPTINTEAYLEWVNTLLEAAAATEEVHDDIQALDTIADRPLSDFSYSATEGVKALGESTQETTATVEELLSLFENLPEVIDDLRLSGDWELADQLEAMNQQIVDTFSQRDFMGLGAPGGELNGFIEVMNLTEEQIGSLDSAWQRSMTAMSSGVIDNTRYMEAWNAILADSTLTDAEKVASLELLSMSTHEYRDSQKAMQEDQLEFLSDGDRILEWWREYDRLINEGAASLDGSAEQLARIEAQDAFRGMVDWAGDINDASRALDQALRTFQQIDDLANRSSAAASIAESLVGEPGVWHEIDDMLSQGLITLEEYNETVEAGHGIQESNVRIQEMLNEVRRNQLPLLHEEQLAYEQNLEYLTSLNAEEQRRALMLQDSSVQAEIATGFNLAYSGSLGEIPKEVVTEMILEKANADEGLRDIWLQMGLLREEVGPDGEVTLKVNFPDADATISAINRMTIAMLELEAVNRNMSGFELAVEIYGEEEAMNLYGLVKEADGTYSKATVAVEAEGVEEATVAVDLVYERVTEADGTEAYMVMRVDADTGELDNFGRIVESYTDEENPNIAHIKVQADDGEFWTTIDLTTGEVGTAQITVEAETSDAETNITRTKREVNDYDGTVSTGYLNADGSQATDQIGIVDQSLDALDGSEAYVDIHARDYASSVISSVAATWGGTIATSFVDIVTRNIPGNALGGYVQEYASGGVVIRAAEIGPEIAHFANGGTALLPSDGLYSVPAGTYISPNNAVSNNYGGINLGGVHIHGNVFGIDDLTEQVTAQLVPELMEALDDHYRSAGVR